MLCVEQTIPKTFVLRIAPQRTVIGLKTKLCGTARKPYTLGFFLAAENISGIMGHKISPTFRIKSANLLPFKLRGT